jgi:integrase
LDRHAGRHIDSKTEADTLAGSIRLAIKAGTFAVPTEQAASPTPGRPERGLTFEEFGRLFIQGFSRDRGKASWDDDERLVRVVMAFQPAAGGRLGERLLSEVGEHDIEEFIRHLVAKGRAISTRNHNVQLLRSMSRWAVRKGYRQTPFASVDSDVIRRRKEMPRRRRLQPGEEEALLKAATPHVRQLIIAALETCCRQGELLSLQWGDVSPQSQAVYRSINLHFHDLRHEAGSRLLEAGWPVHHVQHMLGHANLSQTSTDLNPTAIGLQESMRKLDETRAACKVVANGAVCDPRPVCKDGSHHPDNLLIH